MTVKRYRTTYRAEISDRLLKAMPITQLIALLNKVERELHRKRVVMHGTRDVSVAFKGIVKLLTGKSLALPVISLDGTKVLLPIGTVLTEELLADIPFPLLYWIDCGEEHVNLCVKDYIGLVRDSKGIIKISYSWNESLKFRDPVDNIK